MKRVYNSFIAAVVDTVNRISDDRPQLRSHAPFTVEDCTKQKTIKMIRSGESHDALVADGLPRYKVRGETWSFVLIQIKADNEVDEGGMPRYVWVAE